MLTRIDHAVIVVRDLQAAMRDYSTLGFTVLPGGTHADGATHNALITFADGSYLELLAFTAPEQPQDHPWWPRLAEGEGLEDFALLSDNLPADSDRWRAVNPDVTSPVVGGRARPDGQHLRWRTTRLPPGGGDSALPFVIEDVTPRGLRVPGGDATQHVQPVTGIAGVIVAVRSVEAHLGEYMALLDASAAFLPSGDARLNLGEQWIMLATAASNPAIDDYLMRHGEGPFALHLARVDDAPNRTPTLLDQQLAHGARLEVSR